MFRRVIDHPLFIWTLLALPLFMLYGAAVDFVPRRPDDTIWHMLLHPSGETSVRLLILTMILTPLRRLFPQSGVVRWLIKRRRYLGVASFAYAGLHLMFFVMDEGTVSAVLGSFAEPAMLLGWGAFCVFLPLALTSNDWSVRKLGPRWKALQKWVYPAAAAVALHWVLVSEDIGGALVHFAPLALFEGYRVFDTWRRRQTRLAA